MSAHETESIRGAWNRQIGTQFFERTSHSKQQAAMLARGQKAKPEGAVSVEDEVRDLVPAGVPWRLKQKWGQAH